MALERFNLALAGPTAHADSLSSWDRQSIQALIKDLQEVANDLGLKDRHIRLLTSLASFIREFTSDYRPIVFASNEALSRRTAGMPVSTLQRTLRELCSLELVERNLSPNGKRYPHRGISGEIIEAYGIDLSPLLRRATEIRSLLEHVQERRIRIRLIRDRLSLLRNRFPEDAPEQVAIRNHLRRRHRCALELEATYRVYAEAAEARDAEIEITGQTGSEFAQVDFQSAQDDDAPGAHPVQASANTRDEPRDTGTAFLTCNEPQNDTLYQSSILRIYESEELQRDTVDNCAGHAETTDEALTARELVQSCPEALSYAAGKLESWMDLHNLAVMLAPMIGIGDQLAKRAMEALGLQGFTTTVLCLVQKFGVIRNPAAYLSRLLAPKGQVYSPKRFLRSIAVPRSSPAASA